MSTVLQRNARRLRLFWANPVVMRDLRVRMRGAKSYWHQGLYLLLLSLLALMGYGTAVGWGRAGGAGGMSAVEVQQQLQQFYYFIFITLAALITLIAPALTAVSITTERQRLSLDLLVTTPLTASELLVGKMISSVAFLALLLVLSLPASALCVILGGATLGDVLRVYLLLAIDGLLLAAIGLAMSCATRASMPALVGSYGAVMAFLIVTFFVATGAAAFSRGGPSGPLLTLGVLNPFVAVVYGSKTFAVLGVTLPLWVGTALAAAVLIRLLVTAATYRMGRYGSGAIGSLRRQLLGLTALGVVALTQGVVSRGGSVGGIGSPADRSSLIEGMLLGVFFAAALLLPSLLTPASPSEDDPPGEVVRGRYDVRRVFQPVHAGSLPFFHLWLLTVAASVVLGTLLSGGGIGAGFWGPLALTVLYLSGLGWLFWALSRRAAALVRGVGAARALAFVLFAVLTWAPIALLGVLYNNIGGSGMNDSPLAWVWIFRPILALGPDDWAAHHAPAALLWSAAFCYGLGALVYPVRRDVVLAGAAKEKNRVRSASS